MDELLKLRHDVDVRFVSYGTGTRTLEELGHSLIDLGLPDLAALGVPSLTITDGLNRIDDWCTARVPSNETVFSREIGPSTLAEGLAEKRLESQVLSPPDLRSETGLVLTAQKIGALLEA